MRLALVIPSLSLGGAEGVLAELANYWALQKHQVSLVTLASPNHVPLVPLDPRIALVQIDQSNNEIYSLPIRLKNIIKRIFRVRKTLKSLKPDAIISFLDVMNITVLLASYGLKVPVIISERIDPNYHSIPVLYKHLRLIVYPWADQLITQTRSAASYFSYKMADKAKIIPNAVKQPQNYKNLCDGNIEKIITVGRLEPQKDHQMLIRAFSSLLKHHPKLTLTIYGEGKERKDLEELIHSLHLQGKVSLPGTTSNIQEVLLGADLFIFPSRYEGFPNALCEAMAVGLPVIASSCSGNTEVVREGVDGRLFPVGDIQALTSIALELMGNPKQRYSLAQNARTITERFGSEQIYSLWDQVLLKVTKRSSF